MATRRARIKVAPNLGLSRNKAKPQPVKPKIVMTSDTDEQSEAETYTVNEDLENAVQIDDNKSEENWGYILAFFRLCEQVEEI